MYLTKTINLSIYDCKVQLIITSDARKTINKLYKKHNTDMVYEHYIAGMMFTVSMNKYMIIIDENHLTYNTITHETLHCSLAITADRNIFQEENQCWLLGLLCQDIFTFLKDKKIEIK